MMNTHGTTQLIGRAVLVALLAAPALGAQGNGRWEDRDRNGIGNRGRYQERRLFTWRGTVDNDVRIYIRGSNVQSQVMSGTTMRNRGRVDADNALPRRDGVVRVEMLEGRGSVYVLQQPSARNDYTAILRVRDAQGGAARYRFVAYFDPSNYGRGNGRGSVWGDDSGRVWGDGRGPVWGDAGGEVEYGTPVLRWSGNVDGDLRISLGDGQVNYNVASGERPQNVRTSVARQIPRRDGHLALNVRQSRGVIQVIEQPSAYNGYTAVIRVVDGQGGYGYYDFDVVWR
ncbi:MAG TPA: hypothetical protein VFT29_08760 [Gemmatimonadaceae bacterium]|nr:hypothetical protein [Gemmatimonadaceae bacterium]